MWFPFPYGPMPTQPLGWYKKVVTKPDDFKGMKFRTVGISIDLFQGMGASVNALPGGEIVPALDRGLIEAAEFNNASSDRALGFQDVSKICMLQSYHQNAEQFEVLFNKTKFDGLPDKMKAIIAYARMRRLPTCHGRRSTATRKTTSSCKLKTRLDFIGPQTPSCRNNSRSSTRWRRKNRPRTPHSKKSPNRSAPLPRER